MKPQEPGAAKAAALAARKMVEEGGLFEEEVLQAGGVALSLVRRIFDSIDGAPRQRKHLGRFDPTRARHVALRATLAAGMLVSLRKPAQDPLGADGDRPVQSSLIQEVLAKALRILDEDRNPQPTSTAPQRSEVETATLEAAAKALCAASKWAARVSARDRPTDLQLSLDL